MSWVLRLVAWSTVLAIPCWLLMPRYQAALTAVVNGVLAVLYQDRVTIDVLDVAAPCELGLYVAMCLAGRGAPRRTRRFALAAGIPLIVAAEIVLIVAGMVLVMSFPQTGPAADRALRRNVYILHTVPWATPILTWFWLLGGWELPRERPREPATRKPDRAR